MREQSANRARLGRPKGGARLQGLGRPKGGARAPRHAAVASGAPSLKQVESPRLCL
jgi:hypothetical protein